MFLKTMELNITPIELTMEQEFRHRDVQMINNEILRANTANAKFMESNKWEYNSPNDILNIVTEQMETLNCEIIISCGWLYSFEVIMQLLTVYNALSDTKQIYIIPEILGIVFGKSQNVLSEYIKTLPSNIIEIGIDNIKDIKFSDNGMEIYYNNNVKFIQFESSKIHE